jgi:hypothetical protein
MRQIALPQQAHARLSEWRACLFGGQQDESGRLKKSRSSANGSGLSPFVNPLDIPVKQQLGPD